MFRVLTCLTGEHDLRLVALAGVICFLASCAAVSVMHRATATYGRARAVWTATAGAATGCGIWATHFIAMLAYDPGVVVGYGIVLTVLSLVAAIAVTSAGLALAINGRARWSAPAGGAIVGAGVACMHFLGMWAVELPGRVTWAPDLVVASIVLGIAFAAPAVALAHLGGRMAYSVVAAILLTLAIVSHHFTAMGAVLIVPDPARAIDSLMLSSDALALTIAAAAIALLGMSIVASMADRRAKILLRDRNLLLDAALNNMVQGVNMFDAQARLVLFNERYVKMYRLSPDVVKPGCTIRELVESRIRSGTFFAIDPERYIADLTGALLYDRTSSTKTFDLEDGRVIAVSSQPMAAGGWVVTHEDITERQRAVKELERTRNFYNTVLENVPASIIVKDARDLRYLLLNRASEEFYGIPRDRMIGKTVRDVLPLSEAEGVEARDRHLLEVGGSQIINVRPVETPGNGRRLVNSTRLAITGEDGAPQYLVNLLQDVTEHKRAEARIAHMAHFDGLTDLPNRSAFNECFATTLERAAREKERFALLSLDLDRFKEVNDVFGHAVGDTLLRRAAERLANASGEAFLARLGGDEFAVIVSGSAQPAGAAALAERLMAAMVEDFAMDGNRLHVGLSIGVAIFPADGADASSLMANADAALYRAKTGGRGSIRFFEAEMDHRLRERRALVHDLHAAIERGELMVYYQPQARMERRDHRVRGAGALEASDARPDPARRVHPGGRGERYILLGRRVVRCAKPAAKASSWPRPLQHRRSICQADPSSTTATCPRSWCARCCWKPGLAPAGSSSRSPKAC